MYSYLNYLSYALYPPLYLAGPIMSFNDYVWQVGPLTPRVDPFSS
jgi:D-alanyl-lipoteichoic acid acyltransferase DltB (MBOAT superfamily)